jgi:hypothetical protein
MISYNQLVCGKASQVRRYRNTCSNLCLPPSYLDWALHTFIHNHKTSLRLHIYEHRHIYIHTFIFFLWLDSPTWAWASSFRRDFMVTHIWDTPQSVGLLWTSDQLVAETSHNTQHSQETNTHAPGGIRTQNPSKRAAEDPRLRPHGHWDRHANRLASWKYTRVDRPKDMVLLKT